MSEGMYIHLQTFMNTAAYVYIIIIVHSYPAIHTSSYYYTRIRYAIQSTSTQYVRLECLHTDILRSTSQVVVCRRSRQFFHRGTNLFIALFSSEDDHIRRVQEVPNSKSTITQRQSCKGMKHDISIFTARCQAVQISTQNSVRQPYWLARDVRNVCVSVRLGKDTL